MKRQQIRRFQIGDLVKIFIGQNVPMHMSRSGETIETSGIVIDTRQYPGPRRRRLEGIGRDVGYIKLFVLDNQYREKHSLIDISFRSIVDAYLIAGAPG